MNTFFQLTVDGKAIDENYIDLQDACKAFTTGLNTLLATKRAVGTKLQLLIVDGPPKTERVLASVVVSILGTFDMEAVHIEYNPTEGKFLISPEWAGQPVEIVSLGA
jgi:hypothetical protein